MANGVCRSCNMALFRSDIEECYQCRNRPKCPDCGKCVSVASGVPYCASCNPLRYWVTVEYRDLGMVSGDPVTTPAECSRMITPNSDAAHREALAQAESYFNRTGPPVTITIWKEEMDSKGNRSFVRLRDIVLRREIRARRKS